MHIHTYCTYIYRREQTLVCTKIQILISDLTTQVKIYRPESLNIPCVRTHVHKRAHIMHHASKHVQCRTQLIHTHKHTPSCVDGWGTRAQFGPDILGQYNTQLLSLITLAGTIKPHSAIAHTSQGENLFSLLQRHLSPSWGHSPTRLYWGLKKKQTKKKKQSRPSLGSVHAVWNT